MKSKLRESADVVVVGGGVIGLSVARALALRRVSDVLLLERGRLGSEASAAAAGMLAPQAEADEADDFFTLACQSRDRYPAFASALEEETGIDVELDRAGTIYLAFSEDDATEIEKRYEWQTGAALVVQKLSATDARRLEPCISENARGALLFPHDVQVENRRLINALANSCIHYGVEIATGAGVAALEIERGRVKGIETSQGFVSTRNVVVATGAWTNFVKGLPAIPIEPVRGQMICFDCKPRLARHVIYSPRGYLVPRQDGRLLAGSTTESVGFNQQVTAGGLQSILSQGLEISPHISALPLVGSWAGLRPRATDGLPVLGPCGEIEGLTYATGHYRNGILLAPITGELIAQAIADKVMSTFLTIFTPDRFSGVNVS